MTRAQAIAKAQDYYQKRRNETDRELNERQRDAENRVPGLKELLGERAALPMSALRRAMTDPENAQSIAEEMRLKGLKLNEKVRLALKKAGLGENYLKPRYECEKCRDTGYIQSENPPKTCECFERRVLSCMNEDRKNSQFSARFEDFDESFIPDKAIAEGLTQRALSVRVKQECEDYADMYPDTRFPGIIIFGNSGLGKTFLLSCVCERLQSRGIGALAVSSFELGERIRSKYFHLEDSDAAFAELVETPVLLIDDLGCEPLIKGAEEYLCLLLNERVSALRHTLITTNLSPAQFQEKYSERVMSRLTDKRYWEHLRLLGDDLRRL